MPQFWADPSMARRHSLRQVPRTTQTSNSFSFTDWYWELILYSYGKIISYHPEFTVPTPQSAFRRSWPKLKLSEEIDSFEIEQRLSMRNFTIPFATLNGRINSKTLLPDETIPIPGIITANPSWGVIFECCFKARSSKIECLFCHVSVKRLVVNGSGLTPCTKSNVFLILICLFVCLFVCWTRWTKPEKLYSTSCGGSEVNPLGVVTHGQRHKPRACQRQRYKPRACQGGVNPWTIWWIEIANCPPT